MDEWYCVKGPMPRNELEKMASVGELKPDDMVFRSGRRPMRASTVRNLNWPPGFAVKGASDYPKRPARLLTSIILCTVVGFMLLVWTFVGFFFWIPLLFRSTLIFTGEILCATIMNRTARDLGDHLHKAVTFYISGFVNICESAFGSPFAELPVAGRRADRYDRDHVGVDWPRMLIEVVWSLSFWSFPPLLWNFQDIVHWGQRHF